jgi:hypothetical protein
MIVVALHRLKLLKRQAYGRAGVDFLRHRILALSAGAAASSSVRSAMAAGEVLVAGAHRRIIAAGKGRAGVL